MTTMMKIIQMIANKPAIQIAATDKMNSKYPVHIIDLLIIINHCTHHQDYPLL